MRSILVPLTLALGSAVAQDNDRLRQEYEEKKIQAPMTADGQFKLGQWCDRKKLKEEAIRHYERAIEIDPDHEGARKALGYRRILGRWLRQVDYSDKSWWAHPAVDQKKVDDAIEKGCRFLLAEVNRGLPGIKHTHGHQLRYDELVCYTLLEAGWDRKDPTFRSLLTRVISNPLDKTYHVSLKAMCLAALDPFKYQQQLAQCAQFLVDNQAKNGQWSYGKPTNLPPPGSYKPQEKGPIQEIETGQIQVKDDQGKLRKVGQIEIKAGQNVGEDTGDDSNSQYAALGIRACLAGLVIVPRETILKAETWWEKSQKGDGGWGYSAGPDGNSGIPNEPAWGSMSAGGLGALVIFKYYRKRVWDDKDADWRRAPSVTRGAQWMGQNLTFSSNPKNPKENGGPKVWHHYWVYAVERAGKLLETEKFGSTEWYPPGAEWLLGRQNPDGSWQKEEWNDGGPVGAQASSMKEQLLPRLISETCFAILFLRRATPKMDETITIKSGDKGHVIRAGEDKGGAEPRHKGEPSSPPKE